MSSLMVCDVVEFGREVLTYFEGKPPASVQHGRVWFVLTCIYARNVMRIWASVIYIDTGICAVPIRKARVHTYNICA